MRITPRRPSLYDWRFLDVQAMVGHRLDIPRVALRDFLALTGIAAESGNLERGVSPIELLVPSQCEIQGDRIVWSPGYMNKLPPPHRFSKAWLKNPKLFVEEHKKRDAARQRYDDLLDNKRRSPKTGMLFDFLCLSGGSDAEVISYFKKWGPLCICEHGEPSSHSRDSCGPLRVDLRRPWRDVFWEPIASWRHFAEEALAILLVAGYTHQRSVEGHQIGSLLSRTPPQPLPVRPLAAKQIQSRAENDRRWTEEFNEWWVCSQKWMDETHTGWREPKPPAVRVGEQRRAVAFALNRWLERGGIRPIVSWDSEEPALDFGAGTYGKYKLFNDNLFGALAMELAYAIMRRSRIRKCDGCGRPHSPRRWPRPHEHSFCKACGKRAAWRLSKRRLRDQARR